MEPMKALDERYGSEIDPSVSEISLRPSRLVWAYSWRLMKGITCAHPYSSFLQVTRNITVAVSGLAM